LAADGRPGHLNSRKPGADPRQTVHHGHDHFSILGAARESLRRSPAKSQAEARHPESADEAEYVLVQARSPIVSSPEPVFRSPVHLALPFRVATSRLLHLVTLPLA